MATLIDTSALVVLLRRRPPRQSEATAEAAATEMRASSAVVSAVTVTELLVGSRHAAAEKRVAELLAFLPAVAVDSEVADLAGRMGREARMAGQTIPLPDLQIAATARWLDLPLLTCDSDFARGVRLGEAAGRHDSWRGFRLHPASSVG